MRDLGDSLRAAESMPSNPRLEIVSLAGIKRRQIVCLRPDLRFPLGTIGVLAGFQGLGKSLITCQLGAQLTREGYGVVFVAEEDSAGAVIKPRCEAAGGDVTRMFVLHGRRDVGGMLLPRDTDELAARCSAVRARLIVIDPWSNHVDGMEIDKGSVRAALMPLARVAREQELCVLLVAHPVKRFDATVDPLSLVAHAGAVTQIARAAWWLAKDPDGDDHDRLLVPIKANLTASGPTLRYRIGQVLLEAANDEPEMTTGLATPAGRSDLDYMEIASRTPTRVDDSKLAQAERFLEDALADGRAQERPEVIAAGVAAGHSERTLDRAARKVCHSESRPPGPAVWSLESSVRRDDHAPETGEVGELGKPPTITQGSRIPARADSSPSSPSLPTAQHEHEGQRACVDELEQLHGTGHEDGLA